MKGVVTGQRYHYLLVRIFGVQLELVFAYSTVFFKEWCYSIYEDAISFQKAGDLHLSSRTSRGSFSITASEAGTG